MTDTNSNAVETNDLDAFETEFFGKPAQPAEDSAPVDETPDPVDTDADDTSPVDDTDATNETDTDAEAEGDDTPEEKPKKKSAQERINELTRQKREAERAAQLLEDRLAALEERLSNDNKETTPTAEAHDTGAPDPDAVAEDGTPKYPLGEYDPKFIRDNASYIFRTEREALLAEEAKAREENEKKSAREALNTSWNAKLQDAIATEYTDLQEKGVDLVEQLSDLDDTYADYLATTIMGMDKGVEVFYYLANNPEEARRLVDRGPQGATIALGRIEAKFLDAEENGKEVKPKVSNAPAPPPVATRGSRGRFEVPGDTKDLDAFEAAFYSKK